METTDFEAMEARIIAESGMHAVNACWLAVIAIALLATMIAAYIDLHSNDTAILQELRDGFARVEAAQKEHNEQYRHLELRREPKRL